MSTHIYQFWSIYLLIFNKPALVFLGVLIVFNISSSEFHQVILPGLHRQWWVVPNSPDLNPLDYQVWGKSGVLLKAATKAKTVPKFTEAL